MNSTLAKFGYPNSLIKSYTHWSVLLRPQQVSLGSLILGAHGEFQAFGELSEQAMAELSIITCDIENFLNHCFKYDKINYLMLMMVDPHVHFHVIPRFSGKREFNGIEFSDFGWPGPPDLSQNNILNEQDLNALSEYIKQCWK